MQMTKMCITQTINDWLNYLVIQTDYKTEMTVYIQMISNLIPDDGEGGPCHNFDGSWLLSVGFCFLLDHHEEYDYSRSDHVYVQRLAVKAVGREPHAGVGDASSDR